MMCDYSLGLSIYFHVGGPEIPNTVMQVKLSGLLEPDFVLGKLLGLLLGL